MEMVDLTFINAGIVAANTYAADRKDATTTSAPG